MRSKILAPVVAGVILAASGVAGAETKTVNMAVSASVAANCVVSTQNLAFGAYDGSADKTGTADVSVRCSNGTPYTVKLSAGNGSFAQRLLANGANTLQYNLYTTSAYTSVWGDGTSGTSTDGATGTGLSAAKARTFTVHGQLPNNATNQDAPVGNYADTVTVSVDY